MYTTRVLAVRTAKAHGFWLSAEQECSLVEAAAGYESTRARLVRFIQAPRFQLFLVALLAADVLIVERKC